MLKQIFNHQELIGKTIEQIIIPKYSYQDLWIKFTDQSFVVLDVNDVTQGFGQQKEIVNISSYTIDNTNKELIELGLITKEQYNSAIIEEEKIHEQERLQRDVLEQKRIEDYEKDILSKLKTKYE